MSDKAIVIVTGANQGLGFFGAQKLASTGKYIVLLGSRDLKKGQEAVEKIIQDKSIPVSKENIEAIQIDLGSDDSINAAVSTVEKNYGKLDILVNNAGISQAGKLKEGTSVRAEFQGIYDTNVFGQAVLTDALLPLLRKSTAANGKRIIFVSSSLGSVSIASDLKGMFPGKLYHIYRNSKAAENMLSTYYASLLAEEDFVVSPVCPGYCATNLNGYAGYKDPKDGADIIPHAVEGKAEDVNLKFLTLDNEEGTYPW